MTQSQDTSFNLAALAANLAESKKASETLVLDTGKVSYLADYFVICSGDSQSQIRAIADEIEKAFKQRGQSRLGTGRDTNGKWCLLDFGDVVVHIMHRNERQFYQLENFWSHANLVPAEQWMRPEYQKAAS